MRRLAVILVIILINPALAKAGGWGRDAGDVYLRAGAAWFEGTAAFQLLDDAAPLAEFSSTSAELYWEVGVGRQLELDGSLRWVDNRNDLLGAGTHRSRGLEDLEALVKWTPVSGSRALSLLGGARLSLYERLPVERTLVGEPQRGPGGTDVLIGASHGHSFHPTAAWFNLDVLHRLRVSGVSSGVLIRAELGAMLAPVGGALVFEVQPAFGRDIDQAEGDPSPVPKVLGLGAKLFLDIAAGFGLTADGMWLPDVINDGPGHRIALSATYQSDPE
ncbi:MAG: hypothetical protein OXT09_29340 [Myxococcales bacterium]|nr:hypothetical protein [Myxococcales bacterium]